MAQTVSKKKRIIKIAVQIAAIAVLVLIDKLIKDAVEKNIKVNGPVVLIDNIIGLAYAQNTGAAFSLFSSSTAMLAIVTSIAIAAGLAVLIFIKNKPLIYDICIPLIIAGGAGNLIDRIFRGYVVDYIQTLFINYPIFNFADCLITCSCIALIIYLIYGIFAEFGKKNKTGDRSDG